MSRIGMLSVFLSPICTLMNFKSEASHMLTCWLLSLTNDQSSKICDVSDIDSLICAEIPDPAPDPALFDAVQSCVVHGPCYALRPRTVCMQHGQCLKGSPKMFCEQTVTTHDGYSCYRRWDNGSVIRVAGHQLGNRWIVIYNPWLSQKLCAHIKLEACIPVKSVKYLFKYVNKGHDCANV